MNRLLFCLVVCIINLRAAEPEKLLDSLRAEIKALGKSIDTGDKEAGGSQRYRVESMLAQVPAGDLLRDETLQQTQQIIEQIRAAGLSDRINEICGSLISELRERVAARQKALKEELETSLRQSLTAGLNATNARELDAPLQELARLRKEVATFGYRGDSRLMATAETISSVEQILTTIQDAMVAASNPSGVRGRESAERLKSVAGNYGRNLGDLMPRSEFLERMQAIVTRVAPGQQAKPLSRQEFEKQVSEILSGLKKLDDMNPTLAKIDELIAQQRDVNGYSSDSGLIYQLRSYRRTYEDLRAGTATSMTFSSASSSGTDSQELLNPIKDLLVRFALTRVLGVSGDLAPKDDESISAYLHRALDASVRTANWHLMANVLNAAQTMNLSSVVSTSDSSALRQFLSGINQERAREYSGAVGSYLAALKTGSQVIPVEKIGDKLKDIKAQHPQDYEAGIELANTPMPPPAHFRPMGGITPVISSTRTSTSTSTLAIPAATTPAGSKELNGKLKAASIEPLKNARHLELVKELEKLKQQFTKAGDLQSAISAEALIKALSAPAKEVVASITLNEMTDGQFQKWLSAVTISEVDSPYGNKFTYEDDVLTSIRPGLDGPRSHPTGRVEVGKLIVPFTNTSATITIDPSMTKAEIVYTPGGTYQATIAPRKKG